MHTSQSRLAVAMLLLALAATAAALPPWYKCDASNCAPPACMCASNSPPGGLTPATTPQFILITHDDAINAYSNKVVRSVTDAHTNPNGCNVPATWYTLQQGTQCEIAKTLWEQNHEIALHTEHHLPIGVNFQGDRVKEMLGVRGWLNTTCGIPTEDMVGFRAPYLVSNPAVRKVEHDAGLLYDSSMIQVFSNDSLVETAPGQRVWPFSMDAGIPINCNWNFPDGQCNGTTERYPGLWEVPLWELQNAAGDHLFSMDPTGDVVGILKENFLMNYNGNRAPFGIFVHATWFTPENTASLNTFMTWAMAQPDVWAVTTHQLVQWMQAPVPAAQMNDWYTCKPVNLTATPGDTKCQLYTAKVGDDSYKVAISFAVLPADMLALNPELGDGSKLAVGNQIKIPPWDDTCVGAAVLAVSGPGEAAPAAAPSGPACRTHTVVAGDYWDAVALMYDTNVPELVMANPGLSSESALALGQVVNIPPYPSSCGYSGGASPTTPAGSAPPAALVTSGGAIDYANPSSGANITMRLEGRLQMAFESELERPFVGAVARALGVPVAAVTLMSATRVGDIPARRRLLQVAPPQVDAVVRVASVDPAGVYANATAVFTVGGPFDTTVLSVYGLSLVGPPTVVPFMSGKALEVGADGKVVIPAATKAPPADTTVDDTPVAAGGAAVNAAPAGPSDGGSSGLSTGAIVGIAVGAAVGVALVAAAVVVVVRRRGAHSGPAVDPHQQWVSNPAHENDACGKLESRAEGARPISAVATTIGTLPPTP